MRHRINIYKQKAFRLHKWLDTKSGNFEQDLKNKEDSQKYIKKLLK